MCLRDLVVVELTTTVVAVAGLLKVAVVVRVQWRRWCDDNSGGGGAARGCRGQMNIDIDNQCAMCGWRLVCRMAKDTICGRIV